MPLKDRNEPYLRLRTVSPVSDAFCCCVSEFLWIKAASLRGRGALNLCENNVCLFFSYDRQKLILVLRNAFLCSRSADARPKYGHRKCCGTSVSLNTVGCAAITRSPSCGLTDGSSHFKVHVLCWLFAAVYARWINEAQPVLLVQAKESVKEADKQFLTWPGFATKVEIKCIYFYSFCESLYL